ncbi:protein kinase [Colwellia sp. KU-HH00111]|uniref:protein kinase domain-containing protein n=1 Tax=Colwellia sp. KU-HH00111 TaxID=3127652 RepID=UPI0033656095
MLKLKVSKLKVTRVDLWTTHVMFFTGSLQHKPVFVKLYRDNNKNQREARILQHINIMDCRSPLLCIMQDGSSPHGYFVIAEQIKATPLAQLLDKISFNLCLSLLKQFILILDDFNRMGVVHCDITPNNILVNDTAQITIIDFEYAVCHHSQTYCDLRFETKKILQSLGGDYSATGLVWDDATSFSKIINNILKHNKFPEGELNQIVEQLNILESKIGRNQYKY